MVVSMLLALSTCPAMLGSQEAIRQGQQKERREEHRARRCHLVVGCLTLSRRGRAIDGRQVVLKDNRLWIDTGNHVTEGHHPFTGYYLPFPDCKYEGVVSTITSVAPILNWIYIDKNTYQVKYGVRVDAEPNLTGPFDCTRQDRRLTFEGWEGFTAVEEEPDLWALYFDRDDNGLEGRKPPDARALEITLSRKEMKITPEELRRQQEHQSNIKVVNRASQQQPDAPAPPEDGKAQQEQVDDTLKAPQASAGAAVPEPIPEETEPPAPVSSSSDNPNHVPSSPTEAWGSTSIWSQQTESRAEPMLPFTPASSVYADDRVSENEGRAVPEQETPKAGKTYRSPYIEDADDGKAEDATSGVSAAPAIDLEKKVEEHARRHEEELASQNAAWETVDDSKPQNHLEEVEEHTSKMDPVPSPQGPVDEPKPASDSFETNIDKAAAPTTSKTEMEESQIATPEKVDEARSEEIEPAEEPLASAPVENGNLAGPAEPTMEEEVPMASIEETGGDEKEKSTPPNTSPVFEKPLRAPSWPSAPTVADPAASAPEQQQQDNTDDMLAYLRLLRLQDAPTHTPSPSPWTESEGPHRPLPSPYAPLSLHQQHFVDIDQQQHQQQQYSVDYDEWSQTAPTHLLSPSPTASPPGSKAPTTRSVSLASTHAPGGGGGGRSSSAAASRSSSLTISAPARTREEVGKGEVDDDADHSAAAVEKSVSAVGNGNGNATRPLPSLPPPPPPSSHALQTSSSPSSPPPPPPLSLPSPVSFDKTNTNLDFLSHPYNSSSLDHHLHLQNQQNRLSDTDTGTPPQKRENQNHNQIESTGGGASAPSPSPAPPQWDAEAEAEGEGEGEDGDAEGETKGKKRWSALRTRMKSLRKKSSRKMRWGGEGMES
ncbi:hypothetical protein JOL62DRAFT_558531 [Phyllosticta paracitricarpa]|uniref:Uncharacterized protein n=1 Tax=Phyllosticta paracitricarpa TaxID=2016321 RepID=A0ABR1N1N9_9PEZI